MTPVQLELVCHGEKLPIRYGSIAVPMVISFRFSSCVFHDLLRSAIWSAAAQSSVGSPDHSFLSPILLTFLPLLFPCSIATDAIGCGPSFPQCRTAVPFLWKISCFFSLSIFGLIS